MGIWNSIDNNVARNLISEGKWEEAAGYGDPSFHNKIMDSDPEAWNQFELSDNFRSWDNTTWGNGAMLVYYGRHFPNRKQQVVSLEYRLFCLASK